MSTLPEGFAEFLRASFQLVERAVAAASSEGAEGGEGGRVAAVLGAMIADLEPLANRSRVVQAGTALAGEEMLEGIVLEGAADWRPHLRIHVADERRMGRYGVWGGGRGGRWPPAAPWGRGLLHGKEERRLWV